MMGLIYHDLVVVGQDLAALGQVCQHQSMIHDNQMGVRRRGARSLKQTGSAAPVYAALDNAPKLLSCYPGPDLQLTGGEVQLAAIACFGATKPGENPDEHPHFVLGER